MEETQRSPCPPCYHDRISPPPIYFSSALSSLIMHHPRGWASAASQGEQIRQAGLSLSGSDYLFIYLKDLYPTSQSWASKAAFR